ncbi:MAG: phosphate transport system regulatory protein PhoU [Pseudonocardiaceae bacterium]|nr:MAG: phosphate transport system regulatory protein PhoU [Pseudonocardiaceae bacterium]
MRDTYIEQLDELSSLLSGLCSDVADALDRATRALLESDLSLAQGAIDAVAVIDGQRRIAESRAAQLLALQAPVATDLRVVVSVLHDTADLERMASLVKHVAQAVHRRHPRCVVPREVVGYFGEMGRIAAGLARIVGEVIVSRDLVVAAGLDALDDAVDDLSRDVFGMLVGRDWGHGVSAAVDTTLLSRFYERFADHAVSIGHRVVYVVTGRLPV